MKLDKHSSIPLYAQLRELIGERIQKGIYKRGERIPSELDFCKELDLSRPTVRQAVADLVSDNVLIIKKGKGTFVTTEPELKKIPHFNPLTFSFLNLNSYEDLGLRPIILVEPDPELDEMFKIEAGLDHSGYWLAEWPIADEKQNLGWCRSYIPVDLFPQLGQDITANKRMLDIKSNKYAFLPQKGKLYLSSRPAKSREAAYLDIPKRSFVIAIDGPLLSRTGNICEVLRVVLRPDMIKLEIN